MNLATARGAVHRNSECQNRRPLAGGPPVRRRARVLPNSFGAAYERISRATSPDHVVAGSAEDVGDRLARSRPLVARRPPALPTGRSSSARRGEAPPEELETWLPLDAAIRFHAAIRLVRLALAPERSTILESPYAAFTHFHPYLALRETERVVVAAPPPQAPHPARPQEPTATSSPPPGVAPRSFSPSPTRVWCVQCSTASNPICPTTPRAHYTKPGRPAKRRSSRPPARRGSRRRNLASSVQITNEQGL
jgi:hypothetical protein